MAALLVGIAVMGVMMSIAMPVWRHDAQREKEAELIFRAGQVVHAVELWKRRFAGQNPPSLDVLVQQKFLRKKYKDPMMKDGEWRIVTPAELQGTPLGGVPLPGVPGSSNRSGGNTGSFGAGGSGSGSSSGFGSSSSSSGSSASAFGDLSGARPPGFDSGQSSPGSPSSSSSSSPGGSSSILPTLGAGGATQYAGPVASVASRSKEHSIRIFKGRDRYDQWIVTIDDVKPRRALNVPQPGQGVPGQGGPSGLPTFPGGTSASPMGSGSPPR